MQAEVYWVPGPWPGRVGIVPRPRGGDWLADEVRSWRASGFDVVTSLLTPDEVAEFELQEEASRSREEGLEFYVFPIPDRGVPRSQVDFAKVVSGLEKALESGKNVGIHCRQGIGRSSLIIASLLAAAGEEPDEAFRRIEEARGRSVPDTAEQREWVAQNATAVSAAKVHGGERPRTRGAPPRVAAEPGASSEKVPHEPVAHRGG
jgi:protein-tyrosine phosphatase